LKSFYRTAHQVKKKEEPKMVARGGVYGDLYGDGREVTSVAVTYALRIKFKSNEAPWSGSYEPAEWHQPADDEAAIKWAVGMSDGLGMDYLVTLTKNGVVIPLPLRDDIALMRG
jgi:hypothetical protein